MDGWIKLHRKILDSSISDNPNVGWLFIHLLLRANRKQKKMLLNNTEITINEGQLITGRKTLSKLTGLSEQQIRSGLTALKSTSTITIKPTNKFSLITILNWKDYQEDNQQVNQRVTNKQPTNNQQITTNKNIENVENNLSKDKLGKPSHGNEQVDFVLSLYQKHTKSLPTDKRPRQVAHNIVQITTTFIKEIRPHFPSDRIGELEFKSLLSKAFAWYFEQLQDDVEITRLETVKHNIKARFFERSRVKYIPNYKFDATP